MDKYEELKKLPPQQFRRLTGVKQKTFSEMINILVAVQNGTYRKAGRKGSLSIEDKLLMALEYLREYRTYFHLGCSYGLSESACYRVCRWVEDSLIKSGKFSLPGKKALFKITENLLVLGSKYSKLPFAFSGYAIEILKN